MTLPRLHEHAAAKPALEHTAASDDSDDENEDADSTGGATTVTVLSTHVALCTQF